jgi:hypothetical protein
MLGGDARFADIALALTRAKTGETLLFAGGQWDHLDRRFTNKDPEKVAIIALEESQVEFTKWFEKFLSDYREGFPRDVSAALVAGDRRGGKTFDTLCCTFAALIDVPFFHSDQTPTIGWVVSKTYRERDELENVISNYLPNWFYRHSRAPEHRYTLAHGSYLRNLSADDPNSLKQGRVDFLLFNEPQKMSPKAIKNGLFGTADRGGLMIMAANPPDGPEGDWLRDLKEAIDDDPEIRPITRFFNFSSKQNTKIDAPARKRVAKIANKIDPDMSDADAEGTWRRWGLIACPSWSKDLIAAIPQVGAFNDMTSATTRKLFGRAFEYVIGADFQRKPQAAAVLKIIHLPNIEGPVYWFTHSLGTVGTEVELSTELLGAPHSFMQRPGDQRGAMIVGDCSGSWQGAMRIAGRTSFGLLEAEGWYIQPAEIVKTTTSEHPRNPPVAQRLGLLQRLMEAKRIRVDPSCTWLITSFKKCQLRETQTGTRVPKGSLAHILDAASYAIWRCEPHNRNSGPPSKGSMKSFNTRPTGIRVI